MYREYLDDRHDSASRKSVRKGLLLRIVGAMLGAALLAWYVSHTDREALRHALSGRAALVPLCLLVELLRVGAETFATRSVLGEARTLVSFRRLYLVHLVGFAFSAVLPAPRPIAEATKASLLATRLGLGRCVHVGSVIQASTFLAVGTGSLFCALLTEAPSLRKLLFLNFALLLLMGGGLLALLRSPALHRFLARRMPKRVAFLESFQTETSGARIVGPTLWLLVSVLLQAVLFGLLLRGQSTAPFAFGAATAEGAHIITASVAVLVPGQLGVREIAFAEVAGSLGTSAAAAGALSLLPRAAQLAVAAIGFVTLAFLRDGRVESEP